ncbi:DUF4386 domain-containing protein [Spongiactinospora sp. TRM90649]|uniref:DUF4386 domain-containing protein n=1 Tax=Spongiactinospora sp. TRM90649 TaxID=3031114 RepID=UPI0023F6265B|nr:DUF4386 domain-containing protein [Spongiactinospora sp. TRM90649]MDF5754501.1 DUF4386 domain-containing protein [Spongiactinospora sp. TRM90649]
MKPVARLTGVLYLIVAILGGFAQLYVRASVYVPGDAAKTTENVVANATLFRLGFLADLVQVTCFLGVALLLHQLFRRTSEGLARAMLVLMSVAVSMICLNLLNHFAALLVATSPSYATAFGGPEGSQAMVLLLLELHRYGYLLAQMFFGLWMLPAGLLARRSGLFPKPLGILLIAGSAGYLIDLFAQFTIPETAGTLAPFVLTTATVAEVWLLAYLLSIGVRTPKTAPASA